MEQGSPVQKFHSILQVFDIQPNERKSDFPTADKQMNKTLLFFEVLFYFNLVIHLVIVYESIGGR